MTSNYSSDPRVPPARVGHLGKHRRPASLDPLGLPAVAAQPRDAADPEPTYDDFLDHDATGGILPDKTGRPLD